MQPQLSQYRLPSQYNLFDNVNGFLDSSSPDDRLLHLNRLFLYDSSVRTFTIADRSLGTFNSFKATTSPTPVYSLSHKDEVQ
jgi:hypothetical protein